MPGPVSDVLYRIFGWPSCVESGSPKLLQQRSNGGIGKAKTSADEASGPLHSPRDKSGQQSLKKETEASKTGSAKEPSRGDGDSDASTATAQKAIAGAGASSQSPRAKSPKGEAEEDASGKKSSRPEPSRTDVPLHTDPSEVSPRRFGSIGCCGRHVLVALVPMARIQSRLRGVCEVKLGAAAVIESQVQAHLLFTRSMDSPRH
eukprot:s211_g14.t2